MKLVISLFISNNLNWASIDTIFLLQFLDSFNHLHLVNKFHKPIPISFVSRMSAPNKPSRGFSFFNITAGIGGGGGGGGGSSSGGRRSNATAVDLAQPQLKLEPDRQVYRPGDPVTITVEIKNPTTSCSLLIEKLSFEIKGTEKLDTQWFSTPKPSPDSKQRRGSLFYFFLLFTHFSFQFSMHI